MLRSLFFVPKQHFAFNFFKKLLATPKQKSISQTLHQANNLDYLRKHIKQVNSSKPKLLSPKTDNKLTIVTEIDDTLMYTFTPGQDGYLLAPLRKYDHYHQLPEFNAYLNIYKRKGVQQFLNYLTSNFELVVWTTGHKQYTDVLLSYIDPENKIKNRFHQQYCDRIVHEKEEIDEYVKDLNLLGRDLKRVVSLDSHPFGYWMYPENCVPIEYFNADNTNQQEDLTSWIKEIEKLKGLSDVRGYLNERYLLKSVLEESKLI